MCTITSTSTSTRASTLTSTSTSTSTSTRPVLVIVLVHVLVLVLVLTRVLVLVLMLPVAPRVIRVLVSVVKRAQICFVVKVLFLAKQPGGSTSTIRTLTGSSTRSLVQVLVRTRLPLFLLGAQHPVGEPRRR